MKKDKSMQTDIDKLTSHKAANTGATRYPLRNNFITPLLDQEIEKKVSKKLREIER